MKEIVKISIDAMGGDSASRVIIDAVKLAIEQYSDIKFIIFGNKEIVIPLLKSANIEERVEFIHTDSVIRNCDEPVKAFKSGKNSSMYKAVEAVKNEIADVCVSAGNTGALMVMSKMILGNIKGITRPAIIALMPNKRNHFVMLDLGANSECSPIMLYHFAIMGRCIAKIFLNITDPSIKLLNIGEEKIKGRNLEKEAYELLENSKLNFQGNIEGHKLLGGEANVVLCDGFTGNIALKIMEGAAGLSKEYLYKSFTSSIFSKIGYIFAKNSIERTFKVLDPRYYNGAMFGGVEGIIIKSHGSCDEISFNNAIKNAYVLAKNDVLSSIKSELYYYEEKGLLNEGLFEKLKKKSAALFGVNKIKEEELK